MDRVAAMLILLGMLVSMGLFILALFAVAPIFCSCLVSLLYTLYLFMANEASSFHAAQEFENRFWTIFALLFSTAMFFAKDSPVALGRWSPSLGLFGVLATSYGMHAWDRHLHRKTISRQVTLRRGGSAASSLNRLKALGIPVEDQLAEINSCLADIDQLLIPSTVNNFINQRFILRKEREVISVFEEAEPKALNYIISHVKLGLIFYKIKDHRNFSGQHRTELIELLAVERISVLTVISRVIVLHALQMMKLPANQRAEYWVRNIVLCTKQDELSELKTLTDSKGDYFCMHKLIYDDIRSETVRQDILNHLRKEAAVQQAHMAMGTKRSKLRGKKAWRKILSDVDDTLTCSGGSYPAGVDKRYGKKVVYPGVLAFYRELDLGTQGPEEWPAHTVGNLVFLSARPHVYKDMSEKHNFAKFEKLRVRGEDGKGGMHTIPSLLAGDVASGTEYMFKNDLEPLATKKFENFQRYVAIYPEFKHVFIGDNGQGDVRAGELMFDAFPQLLEAVYIHIVKDLPQTHGYAPERWREKGLKPCFFRSYPEAALDAATRKPPLIRVTGLQRVCHDAIKDFYMIQTKEWPSQKHKWDQRESLNQSLWRVNQYLCSLGEDEVPLIEAERLWRDGQLVRTPHGIAKVLSFDPLFDLYRVELDWRPLDVQLAEFKKLTAKDKKIVSRPIVSRGNSTASAERSSSTLETVVELAEEIDDDNTDANSDVSQLERITLAAGASEGSRSSAQMADVSDGLPECLVPVSSRSDNEEESILCSDRIEGNTFPPADTGNISNAESATDSAGAEEAERVADPINEKEEMAPTFPYTPIYASFQGRHISKYSPPSPPLYTKEDKIRGSVFSFWGTAGESKGSAFKPGEKCTTPFGPATVIEYREEKGLVIVDMIGWSGRCYLQKDCVKIISKGLLSKLLRRISAGDSAEAPATQKRTSAPKALEFVFVKGSTIQTPFGEGVVSRPLPVPGDNHVKESPKKSLALTTESPTSSPDTVTTIGISLTSWSLGNETHQTLYCTPNTAREWKKVELEADGKSRTIRLFSVFGTLAKTVRSLTSQPKKKKPVAPRYMRYYQDGAAVTTSFGDGVVRTFRETDGFYVVTLAKWITRSGMCATAYLQKDNLSCRIARGCHEGYPVLTSLGVSGILASVIPTTGVHIVTVPSACMVCYLQPEDVIRPLKAAVGEDVLTPCGEGKVQKYRVKDDMYEIHLSGFGGMLYGRGERFDRVEDAMQDGDGQFGVNWLLRFFFSQEKKKEDGSQRSRSNSIVSLSVRSQSGMSVT